MTGGERRATWRGYFVAGDATALLLCFGFLFWANFETPFWADDYCRMIDTSVIEAVTRSWQEYFTWTGRFFTSAMTYIVMSTGRTWGTGWFDLANSLIFLGLIRMVLQLTTLATGIRGQQRSDQLAVFTDTIFVASLLWWLPRTIGEVALWKTGSIGYLWPVTGELLLLERLLSGKVVGLWLIPFAFFIATFLEPLSVLMSCTLWGLALLRWRREGAAASRLLLTSAAHTAGTVFVCAAPGNFARAAAMAPSPPMDRIVGLIGNLGSLFDGYWLIFIAVIALAFMLPEDRLRAVMARFPGNRLAASPSPLPRLTPTWQAGNGWTFLVLAVLYMLLLLSVPRSAMAARLSFPASVFLVCYLASLFRMRPVSPARNQFVTGLMLLLIVLHGTLVVPALVRIAQIDRRLEAAVRPLAGSGADAILPIARINGRTIRVRKYEFYEGITPNPNYFINVCFARAMGLHTTIGR